MNATIYREGHCVVCVLEREGQISKSAATEQYGLLWDNKDGHQELLCVALETIDFGAAI